MTPKKAYYIMCATLALVTIGAFAVLVFSNSILQKQSQKLTELKVENQVVEEQQRALTQAKKDIEKYEDFDKIASSVVPQDKDQARAVREIVAIAEEYGIKINSITFPSSDLGTKTPAPAANSQNSGEGGEAAPKAEQKAISQAKPVKGISGVYSLEMTVQPSQTPVNYYNFLDFLKRIENNRRTAQITQVNITPANFDAKNPRVTFTMSVNIFLKP